MLKTSRLSASRWLLIPAALVLVALTGCSHTLTKQEKDEFLARQDEVAFDSPHRLPPSGTLRLPLKAGQWAIVASRLRDSKGNEQSMSFSKYKIVRVEGDTLTMEIESQHAGQKGPTVMAYVVEHFPMGKQLSYSKDELDKFVGNIEFKRIVVKTGTNAPTEVPLALVPFTRSYVKNLLLTGYRVGAVKNELCATDTLASKKCVAYDYQVELPGYSARGHVDAHSAVPVVGFVSQHDDQTDSHVIAFGLTGAKGILIQ